VVKDRFERDGFW